MDIKKSRIQIKKILFSIQYEINFFLSGIILLMLQNIVVINNMILQIPINCNMVFVWCMGLLFFVYELIKLHTLYLKEVNNLRRP